MSLFNELKRRNVFKMGIAYVIVAWLVAQVLQLVFESFGTPGWAIKTVLVLLATGLPFVLFFSWAFELTPDGIKRDHEVDRSQSITPQTGNKLDRMIMVVMALALAYFAYDKFVLSEGRDAALIETAMQTASEQAANEETLMDSDKSIAVLPFVNMSADPDQEFFSDGISEELLNVLAKVNGLRVTSRTSAFAFKGKDMSIREVAAQLGVGHVLEGSVRKAGDKVRITAQLIEVETDSHLWSEVYDRQLDDVFAIQDEIAQKVGAAMQVALLGADATPIETSRKTEVDVYSDYLLARQKWANISIPNLSESVRLLKSVIERDPGYAKAYAALAAVYWDMAIWGGISLQGANEEMLPLLERALELDASVAEAWQLMAYVKRVKGDSLYADLAEKRAIEIDPQNWWVVRGQLEKWAFSHTPEQGQQFADALLSIDPLNPRGLVSVSGFYFRMSRDDESLGILERIKDIDPGNLDYLWQRHSLERLRGNLALSFNVNLEFVGIDALDPETYGENAYLLMAMGEDPTKVQKWIDRGREVVGPRRVKNDLAQTLLHLYRGQTDKAIEIAEYMASPEVNSRGFIYDSRTTALRILSARDASAGQFQEALLRYESRYPELLKGHFVSNLKNTPSNLFMMAIDIASLLQGTGEDARAALMFEMIEKELPFWPRVAMAYEYGSRITEAEMHALRGDKESSLKALGVAVKDGWLADAFWNLEMNPHFTTLLDEPGFRAIVKEVEVKRAAQLELERVN